MEAALNERRERLKDVNVSSALDQILSSQMNSKANPEAFKSLQEQAQLPVTDLTTVRKSAHDKFTQEQSVAEAKEQQDANSPLSKSLQDFARMQFQSVGMNDAAKKITNDMSAATLQKLYPQFTNITNARQAQLAKAELIRTNSGGKLDAKAAQMATHLRDKVNQIDTKEKYSETQSNYSSLKQRLDGGQFNSVDDIMTTYALMKSLDPGSVVRESEFDTLVNSQGGMQKIANTPEKFFKGNIYSPEFRKKLVDSFGRIAQSNEKRFVAMTKPYDNQTTKLGIDRELIFPTNLNIQPIQETKSIAKKQYSPSRNKTRVTYSDGSTQELEGKQ
jgi:hypothetical protein